ncbi:MAG TPA: peptidoglycan-binding protein [Solirubrobacteraceae bacterium]|nr:peptidoglycan-binding protein [Solirubrobacteraceae bacterium]
MRRVLAAAGAAVVAAVVAIVALGTGGDPGPASAAEPAASTATVERRDLVDRDVVQGTLGYADASTLAASATGTITRLPEPGTLVRRGHALYDADNAPAAWLLYGDLPAWRDFNGWMSDGDDVRQLERNLRALGYDPDHDMTIDDDWTSATTAAVERFQHDHGLTEDGSLSKGEVVFRPGPTRVGDVDATVGQSVVPGARLAELTSTSREITVELEAFRQELAREGDDVTVDLPNGRSARGRISDVAKVADPPASRDADPTIAVTIVLHGRAARGTGLDQAPVDVGFARERSKDVLAVPITALLARSGGGFAVEVVSGGSRRLVPVRLGTYAEDYVAVSGDGLREGMTVVTAQ